MNHSLLLLAPEGDVVTHQLQDHRTFLVILLIHRIDVSNRLLKSTVG